MNKPILSSDPAFPIIDTNPSQKQVTTYLGFSKREQFAAMAMQGMLGSTNGLAAPAEAVCRIAVDMADLMIKYLNDKEVK